MHFAFFSNKYDPIAIWTTHLTGLVVELFVFYSVWLWLGCYLHLPNRDLATICFNLNSDFGTKYGPYCTDLQLHCKSPQLATAAGGTAQAASEKWIVCNF